MSAKRPKTTATSAGGAPVRELTAAFERQKHAFLVRHAAECPYLLVQLQPDLPARRLILIVSYSFSADREWQQVETQVPIAGLAAGSRPEALFAEAFARLDDGIGAARIARLFAPRTEAQRLVDGR
jgi:hypothetical protein